MCESLIKYNRFLDVYIYRFTALNYKWNYYYIWICTRSTVDIYSTDSRALKNQYAPFPVRTAFIVEASI